MGAIRDLVHGKAINAVSQRTSVIYSGWHMSLFLSAGARMRATLFASLVSLGDAGCSAEGDCDGALSGSCGSTWQRIDLSYSISDGVRLDLNGDGSDELALISRTGQHLLVFEIRNSSRVEMLGDLGDPQWIEKGDLDGDGREDLVVASAAPRQLVLLRSVGDGSLERLGEVELEKWAHALLTADLDDDGRVELIVADGDRVQVFDPTGAKLGDYAAGVAPASLTVGDLDLDGALDVVAADYEQGEVISFLGDGSGGLSQSGSIVFGPSARYLDLADVDGDGLLDVLVRDSLGGGLWLATGDGAGAFSGARSVDLGPSVNEGRGVVGSSLSEGGLFGVTVPAEWLRTRLFAADGTQAGYSAWWTPDRARVFNDELVAGASWAMPVRMQAGMQPVSVAALHSSEIAGGTWTGSVAVGDLDGDGHQDIALQDRRMCTVHVLFGDGTLSLDGAWTAWPQLEICTMLQAVDVNGDGRDELLGYSEVGMQLVYRGEEEGPDVRPAVSVRAENPVLLKGSETAIFVVQSGYYELTPVIVDPEGGLQPGEAVQGLDIGRLFAGDLDGDGDDDLMISHPGADRLTIYEHIDEALIAGPTHDFGALDPPIERWKIDDVLVADLDADGVHEVLVIGGDEVSVVRDVGSQTPFVSKTMSALGTEGHGYKTEGTTADLNGDGHLDLVLDDSGVFRILHGTDDGFVDQVLRVPLYGVNITSSGDLDGDGSQEFVGFDGLVGDELRVYGSRDVTLPSLDREPAFLPFQDAYEGLQSLRLGDIDGDGQTDLLLRRGSDEALLWGDGGHFARTTALRGVSPHGTEDLRLVDLDGDGQDERIVVTSAAAEIRAWTWEGRYWDPRFTIEGTAERGARQSLLVDDIDGDGIVDIAAAWGAREADLTTGVQVAFGEASEALDPAPPAYSGLEVILQRPYAGWLPEEPPIEGPAPSLQSGDLDGDGRPELIVDGSRYGETLLLWNEGDRSFRAEVLDATSARIIGPGDLVLTEDGVLWRVPVYGRRLGARARVAEVSGYLREVTECTGDELPDLLLSGSPGLLVGVSGSFVRSANQASAHSCARIDGDELPDRVSSYAYTIDLWLTDPPS